MWNLAGLALLHVGLVGHMVLAQDLDLAHSFSHSNLKVVTKTTWVHPVVTLYAAQERQADCAPHSLGFCADVSRSMFSLGSMTTAAPSPTATIKQEGPFAIEVQLLEPVEELSETQYLAIAGEYVILYPGPHIPGWFLDSDGNLIFDNTGLRLGISPLDEPSSRRKRMLEAKQDDSGYDTVIAGSGYAPPSAKVFTKWAGNLSTSTPLRILDQDNGEVNLGLMGCKLDVPDIGVNVQAWQLEASYNVEEFHQGIKLCNGVDPAHCHPIRLLPVTSVPVSTAVSSHTSNYITRTSSAAPSPTNSWTSFPIIVDFDKSNSPGPQADYYIEEDNNGYAYVAKTSSPPYYHYHNLTGFLTSEVTGNYLIINVVDSPTESANYRLNIKVRRQTSMAGNNYFSATVEDDGTIIPSGNDLPTFVVCPPNSTTENDSHSIVLAYNPDSYIQEEGNADCVTASLSLHRDAPIPSTTTVPTTITTTTTPTSTATALSPNVSGCNALNYTLAYSTTGLMNSFATACWCYSYLASTISGTTTQDCTPTIYKVVPSITSISVSSVLSSTNSVSPSGGVRSDRESINSHHRFKMPRNTVPSDTSTTFTNDDITVVPTPTEWFSLVEASSAYFTSYCSSVFEDNGIETLTITSLSVVSSTVSIMTISQTTVQTVCYQEVWEPGVTTSTPAIVICPATVTGSA
ncbi:hypothetical protein TWF281_002786 [Arthrobotrys megalospora]